MFISGGTGPYWQALVAGAKAAGGKTECQIAGRSAREGRGLGYADGDLAQYESGGLRWCRLKSVGP